jgi:hypothetical protein
LEKFTYQSEYFNLFIVPKDDFNSQFEMIFAPTKNHVHPPVDREELKNLSDFIIGVLNITDPDYWK